MRYHVRPKFESYRKSLLKLFQNEYDSCMENSSRAVEGR